VLVEADTERSATKPANTIEKLRGRTGPARFEDVVAKDTGREHAAETENADIKHNEGAGQRRFCVAAKVEVARNLPQLAVRGHQGRV
jgi:hypothetical protein